MMANPDAVMRAAQKPPMGGGMPPAPPQDAPKPPQEASAPAPGLDGMVKSLEGVGAFLQSKGPEAQEAMGHFQALLQSLAKLGGGQKPEAPMAPKGPGKIHESEAPGVQVL